MHDEPKSSVKPPYEKPSLRAIELIAEEVMGGGCKTMTGNNGAGGYSCTFGPCSTVPGS